MVCLDFVVPLHVWPILLTISALAEEEITFYKNQTALGMRMVMVAMPSILIAGGTPP